MNKTNFITFALGAALMFGNTDAAAKSENLALKVTGTDASVQNSAHPSALAVDNNRGTYWSGYNGKASNGQYQYIELQWDRPAQIQKLYVYWRVSADTWQCPPMLTSLIGTVPSG